jgi:hypothetical protein
VAGRCGGVAAGANASPSLLLLLLLLQVPTPQLVALAGQLAALRCSPPPPAFAAAYARELRARFGEMGPGVWRCVLG